MRIKRNNDEGKWQIKLQGKREWIIKRIEWINAELSKLSELRSSFSCIVCRLTAMSERPKVPIEGRKDIGLYSNRVKCNPFVASTVAKVGSQLLQFPVAILHYFPLSSLICYRLGKLWVCFDLFTQLLSIDFYWRKFALSVVL